MTRKNAIGMFGAVVAVLYTVLAITATRTEDIMIPSLDFRNISAPSPLLGAIVSTASDGLTMTRYTQAEAAAGIVVNADEHNVFSCAANGSLLTGQALTDPVTRFWGYEYSGNEVQNKRNGLTGIDLFDGEFFISQGELNASPGQYDSMNTLSGIEQNKLYYFMAERDLSYACSAGIDIIPVCGNGVVDAGEQCDDGNTIPGDGCSATCQIEASSSSSSSSPPSSSSSSSSSQSSASSISSISSASSASSSSSSSCPACFSLNFDGSDYVNVPNNPALDVTGEGTVSIWIKPIGTQQNDAGLVVKALPSSSISADSNYYLVFTTARTIRGGITGFDLTTTTAATNNEWQHILLTWNATEMKIFRNGTEIGWRGVSTAPVAKANNLYIGRRAISATTSRYFTGLMDDVRIYNRYFTQAEVSDLASGNDIQTGILGHWRFNEGSGTSTTDSSGNGNNGALTGNTWSSDTDTRACNCAPACSQCYALDCDGIFDSIVVNDPGAGSPLDLTGNGAVSLWAKPQALQDNSVGLVVKAPPGISLPTQANYYLAVENGSNLRGGITGTDFNPGASFSLTTGVWQHVVLTWNGADVYMYLNNSPLSTPQISTPVANNDILNIGRRELPDIREFNGILDDVRIYNRYLAPIDVFDLYGGFDIKGGLTGHWQLDEGGGLVAADSSGNNNAGAVQGNPNWLTDFDSRACYCSP